MQEHDAAEAARRIAGLWPTVSPEQINAITKSLVATTVEPLLIHRIIGTMYESDSKFFLLSDLKSRVGELQRKTVDPYTLPNSFEAQAKRRSEIENSYLAGHRDLSQERNWFSGLPAEERLKLIEEFKQTAEYQAAQAYCDHALSRGKYPGVLLLWLSPQMNLQAST